MAMIFSFQFPIPLVRDPILKSIAMSCYPQANQLLRNLKLYNLLPEIYCQELDLNCGPIGRRARILPLGHGDPKVFLITHYVFSYFCAAC